MHTRNPQRQHAHTAAPPRQPYFAKRAPPACQPIERPAQGVVARLRHQRRASAARKRKRAPQKPAACWVLLSAGPAAQLKRRPPPQQSGAAQRKPRELCGQLTLSRRAPVKRWPPSPQPAGQQVQEFVPLLDAVYATMAPRPRADCKSSVFGRLAAPSALLWSAQLE